MEAGAFKTQVWGLMRDITDRMNGVFHPMAARYGLTTMQLRVLFELQLSGGHTIGSLSRSVCAAGTNVSALCKRLERAGLVERARDPQDERVVRISLTEAGRRTAEEIDRCVSQAFPLLSEEDAGTILAGLQTLGRLLEEQASHSQELNRKG